MGTQMSITKDMGRMKEKGDESIVEDCTCFIFFAPSQILLKEIFLFLILFGVFSIYELSNCLRRISSTEWCRILRRLGWSCESSDFYPNLTGLEKVNFIWNWILKVGPNGAPRPAMGTLLLVKTWTAMPVMVEIWIASIRSITVVVTHHLTIFTLLLINVQIQLQNAYISFTDSKPSKPCWFSFYHQ